MTESEKENATEMTWGEFAKEFSVAVFRNIPAGVGVFGIAFAFLNAAQTGYKEQYPIESTVSLSADQNIITLQSESWDLSFLNSVKELNIKAYIIDRSLVCEFSQTTDSLVHAIPSITRVASCAPMTTEDIDEVYDLMAQIEPSTHLPSANIT